LSEGEKQPIETFHYEINIDDADEYLRFKQIREQEEKEKKRKKRRSILTLSIVALLMQLEKLSLQVSYFRLVQFSVEKVIRCGQILKKYLV